MSAKLARFSGNTRERSFHSFLARAAFDQRLHGDLADAEAAPGAADIDAELADPRIAGPGPE